MQVLSEFSNCSDSREKCQQQEVTSVTKVRFIVATYVFLGTGITQTFQCETLQTPLSIRPHPLVTPVSSLSTLYNADMHAYIHLKVKYIMYMSSIIIGNRLCIYDLDFLSHFSTTGFSTTSACLIYKLLLFFCCLFICRHRCWVAATS